jgi:hypothetical protein
MAAEALQRRLREIRGRRAVREREYRERNHAGGVWFRLRRLLAYAAEVYAIPIADAERLVAEGVAFDPTGADLEPPVRIAFVSKQRAERIGDRTAVPFRLGAVLLLARAIVLVPFDDIGPPR